MVVLENPLNKSQLQLVTNRQLRAAVVQSEEAVVEDELDSEPLKLQQQELKSNEVEKVLEEAEAQDVAVVDEAAVLSQN